ncbi:MAG TPA: hypothetical protein VN950_00845 [Terriglobales bacterium]|nr:hypothetical protein [Terriglobales bacterium]
MAGIFQNGAYINGFDYANALSEIFDFVSGSGASLSSGTTRFGSGQSLQLTSNNSAGKNLLTQLATKYDGIAFITAALPSSGWFVLYEWYDSTGSGAVQVSLQYNQQGALGFFKGSGTGTQLGSSSANGIIAAGRWVFLEAEVVFSVASGSVTLYAWGPNGNNGASPVISATSVDTAPSGNAWTDRIYFITPSGGPTHNYDDWYNLDATGSSPLNTFLGNGRVQTDAPTSDATPNQFTSSDSQTTGNHYKDVNQLPVSSDSKYLFDNNVGDEELFGFPNLTASQVLIINEIIRTELDASGSRTVETVLSSSSATQNGTAFQPSTTFAFYNTLSAVDPNTGSPWASGTVAAAQSAKLGLKIAS